MRDRRAQAVELIAELLDQYDAVASEIESSRLVRHKPGWFEEKSQAQEWKDSFLESTHSKIRAVIDLYKHLPPKP